MTSRPRVGWQTLGPVVFLALVAGWFALWAPRQLTLASDDSINYLEGAKNIAAGRGYSDLVLRFPRAVERPITHFPPLTSLAIAATGRPLGDFERGAWWVNLLCYAASIGLAAWIGKEAAGGKSRIGLLTALPLLILPQLPRDYTSLGSEAIFYPLVLLGWLGLLRFGLRQRQADLWMGAAGFGLAVAARYAGLIWCVTLPVLVFALAAGGIWLRIRLGIGSFALALLPSIAVWIRNKMVAGSAMNRAISIHWMSADHWREAATTFAWWFLPYRLQNPVAGSVVMGLCLIAFLCAVYWAFGELRRPVRDPAKISGGIAATLALSYAAFLTATISLVHFNTPLDPRILGPVLVFLLVGAVPLIFSSRQPQRRAVVVGGIFAVFLLWQTVTLVRTWLKGPPEVHGFRSPRYQQSALFAPLRQAPDDALIVSNNPRLTSFIIDRQTWRLPQRLDPQSFRPNPYLEADLAVLQTATAQRGGFLLLFSSLADGAGYRYGSESGMDLNRVADLQPSDLPRYFSLRPLVETPEGILYAIQPAGP